MASAIFHKHAKAFTGGAYDPDHSGAEWWLQGIHCRNTPGMQWHVDVDRRSNRLVHPMLTTVTYFSPGEPTVVLTKGLAALDEEDSPMLAYVDFPEVGKHVAFDGSLLGGDLGTGRPPAVALWVNVWINHKPATMEPFPQALVDRMSQHLDPVRFDECSHMPSPLQVPEFYPWQHFWCEVQTATERLHMRLQLPLDCMRDCMCRSMQTTGGSVSSFTMPLRSKHAVFSSILTEIASNKRQRLGHTTA
jgi:hypothetical protein